MRTDIHILHYLECAKIQSVHFYKSWYKEFAFRGLVIALFFKITTNGLANK
jgi:hypothetical protein